MPGHHPYDTYRNEYYFRPYNWQHYQEQQNQAIDMGCGTDSQPYTGDTFERAYQDTLEQTQRDDKRYLEYSSHGGQTWFEGHRRYGYEQQESFFPQDAPDDIRWESQTFDLPPTPQVQNPVKSSSPGSKIVVPYETMESADTPDTVSDWTSETHLRTVDRPAYSETAPSPSELKRVDKTDAINNLIDEMLPVGPKSKPAAANPFVE